MPFRIITRWIICVVLSCTAGAVAADQIAELSVDTASFFSFYGQSVAMDGDVVMVAAPDDAVPDNDTGSVYVFRDTGSGYVEEQKLTASDGQAGSNFGRSLDIEGDLAVICAPGPLAALPGSAYVFRYNGTSWVEEQVLSAPGTAWFGWSVDLQGDRIVVGAMWTNLPGGGSDHRGDAWVFRYDGSSWVTEQQLTASDGVYSDLFGSGVAIDGDQILVGARGEGNEGQEMYGIGAVYAFEWNGTTWNETQKLRAFDEADQSWFGWDVAIHNGFAIVGSPGKKAEGVWSAGAAYILEFDGASWGHHTKVRSHAPSVNADFGHAVAIENGFAVAADYGVDSAGNRGGAIFPYRFDGVEWDPEPAFQGEGLLPDDVFGYDVDLSGSLVVAGAYVENPPPLVDGAGFVFDVQPPPPFDCGGIDDEDVLFVNGDQGPGAGDWEVNLNPTESITFSIEKPSGGGNGKFLAHLNSGVPDATTVTPLPGRLGDFCFPALIPPYGDASPVAVWNNIGKVTKVGSSKFFGSAIPDPARAPVDFFVAPSGDTAHFPPGSFWTLQAVILNPAASSPKNASVTNPVVIVVEQ